ncbi:glucoamylase S2-like [Callorhinchus milii]|uniref:glucoamylase S2-like n=1 Tax=Callorhinchus milii TaxID=7868 RepID=UPI001C3F7281|nr:glucoamylase S2-like [Callorhinchus milii]
MWLKFVLISLSHLSIARVSNGNEKTEPASFTTSQTAYLPGNSSGHFRLNTSSASAIPTNTQNTTNSQKETEASSLSSSNQSVSTNTTHTMPPNSKTVFATTTDIILSNNKTVFANTSQLATTVLPTLPMNTTIGNPASNSTTVVTTSAPNVTFNGTVMVTSYAPNMTNRFDNSSHIDITTDILTNGSAMTTPSQVSDTHSPSTSLAPTTASFNDSKVTTGQKALAPLTTSVISILISVPTRLPTNSTGKDVKTLTETKTGSVLIVVLILVCIAAVLLILVLYWKKRRVMYSRLNDNNITRSWSSYNNPVFEDS